MVLVNTKCLSDHKHIRKKGVDRACCNRCQLSMSSILNLAACIVIVVLSVIKPAECTNSVSPKRNRRDFDNNYPVFNMTIPKNDPANACIRMESSFVFNVTYFAHASNGSYLRSSTFVLSDADNFFYTGFCTPERNLVEISFLNNWRLELYFFREAHTFLLRQVFIYYKLAGNPTLFPHAASHEGAQSEDYSSVYVNSSLQHAYACKTGLRVDLGEVVVHVRNLRLQTYFSKRPSSSSGAGQSAAETVSCAGDEVLPLAASKINNMWSIFLVCLFFGLIVVCCVLFICLKARNDRKAEMSEYKTVKAANNAKFASDTLIQRV